MHKSHRGPHCGGSLLIPECHTLGQEIAEGNPLPAEVDDNPLPADDTYPPNPGTVDGILTSSCCSVSVVPSIQETEWDMKGKDMISVAKDSEQTGSPTVSRLTHHSAQPHHSLLQESTSSHGLIILLELFIRSVYFQKCFIVVKKCYSCTFVLFFNLKWYCNIRSRICVPMP